VSVDNATVVVTFEGTGTNLESVEASTDIVVADSIAQAPPGDDDPPSEGFPDTFPQPGGSELVWAGLAVALVLIVTVVYLRRRREGMDSDAPAATGTAVSEPTEPDPSESPKTDVSKSALQAATDALSEGYQKDAVVTA
jgi:hypothetical protein